MSLELRIEKKVVFAASVRFGMDALKSMATVNALILASK